MTIAAVCKIGFKSDTDDRVSELNKRADDLLNDWLNDEPKFHKYTYDNAKPLPTEGNLKLAQLIESFDTMKYFKEVAKNRFPSVILLVRIHFSKMDNAGFQERVFSTASNVMMKNQASMGFEEIVYAG